jgi:fluoride ion exporter CrcB/FEX
MTCRDTSAQNGEGHSGNRNHVSFEPNCFGAKFVAVTLSGGGKLFSCYWSALSIAGCTGSLTTASGDNGHALLGDVNSYVWFLRRSKM